MNLPPIIGISGKAGVGKDTLAEYLVKQYGYMRYGFADPIKDLLNERFGWTKEQWEDRNWKETIHPCFGMRDNQGAEYTNSHTGFSPRSWAQWLGTEVGRETFGEDCWVDYFCTKVYKSGLRYVISDVRFENEARMIRDLGGSVIHLMRPGVSAVASHISEAGILEEENDWCLYNNGTILDLQTSADRILRSI